MTEILESNVLVVSKKGKVLGKSRCLNVQPIGELIACEVGEHIEGMLNERLLSILSTKENVNLQTLGFSAEQAEVSGNHHANQYCRRASRNIVHLQSR